MCTAIFFPQSISFKNKFFDQYINHEMIAIIWTISAISLPLTLNSYLTVARISQKMEFPFEKTKTSMRRSVYALTFSVFSALLVVIIREPLVDYFDGKIWIENIIVIVAIAIHLVLMLGILEVTLVTFDQADVE
jgi:hypothetical protein